ncbi:MAG: tRNA epoxyqueuosine(34) reductase QueG [Desulfobacteraceae bacterium]|nr:tRNA epoxyqueuosine(34) reductase QueG [Desulfobacteraceae bacterium]
MRNEIRAKALEFGFDAVGFAGTDIDKRSQNRLREFTANSEYGTMEWMARNSDLRASPKALWPCTESIIILGINYGPGSEELENNPEYPYFSLYARNKDYHDVVKKRLKKLARWLCEKFKCEVKVFVDTAPVLEKAIAAKSGIGWQGSHTNIVSRKFGSWLFLGEIFTTLRIPPDKAEQNRCGTCRKCIDACPSWAFSEPGRLDPRKCISYLTIEHKGSVPPELRQSMGNRIYGCDDCLAACPWNRFAKPTQEPAFMPKPELSELGFKDFLEFDDADFRQFFRGSPIKRIGIERFLRNTLICAGNSGNLTLKSRIEKLLHSESAVIRETAAWALSQIEDR